MERRDTYIRLALLCLVVFLVTPMLKYLGQSAWIYLSSAVTPNSTGTTSFANEGKVLLSVGGERWASWYSQEQATAFHALVIPPWGAFRKDGGSSGGDDFTHKVTLEWLRTRDRVGAHEGAEAGSFTIVYHALTQSVSVGTDTYRLAKGNIFVVRLDDEWQPHVTQVEAVLDKPAELVDVVEFFKHVLPDDEEVKKLL